MRQIIFDTETTGFKPAEGDRIVEIGALEMINGALTGKQFHCYINPERDMPEAAFRVHGLSADFLADKPVFADPQVGAAFLEFVGDGVLVAHNAQFDMGFIQFELERAGLAILDNEVVDTLVMARRKFPGAPASLDALCSRFGINTDRRAREGHGALLDAGLLAEVYIELTGGAQAGLELVQTRDPGKGVPGDHLVGEAGKPMRKNPRASLLSDEERRAHQAFIGEMENALWK